MLTAIIRSCTGGEARTPDTRFWRPVLYQLSYSCLLYTSRLTLNQKASELEKQKQEFQTKYQNNAYLSQERAQQEYNRIAKLEQDLQNLSNKLQSELMSENEKNSLQLRDSINAFLKEYNKTKGYSMIISNTGFDNLLYADSVYNITREILDGLNARYSSPVKK